MNGEIGHWGMYSLRSDSSWEGEPKTCLVGIDLKQRILRGKQVKFGFWTETSVSGYVWIVTLQPSIGGECPKSCFSSSKIAEDVIQKKAAESSRSNSFPCRVKGLRQPVGGLIQPLGEELSNGIWAVPSFELCRFTRPSCRTTCGRCSTTFDTNVLFYWKIEESFAQ